MVKQRHLVMESLVPLGIRQLVLVGGGAGLRLNLLCFDKREKKLKR